MDLRFSIDDFRLLVEMVPLDIVTDRKWNVVAEGLSIGDAAADLARGDLEQRRIHIMDLGADPG